MVMVIEDDYGVLGEFGNVPVPPFIASANSLYILQCVAAYLPHQWEWKETALPSHMNDLR